MITKNILDDENVEDIEIGACNWNIESLTQYCPLDALIYVNVKIKEKESSQLLQKFCYANKPNCKFYSKYKLLKI